MLPDGRIAAPLGAAVFVGTNPLALQLTPNGRYAVVANAEQTATASPPARDPNLVPGYSLAVVDTRSLRVVSVYHDAALTVFDGLAVTADPADRSRTIVLASDGAHGIIRIFDLGDDGVLTPRAQSIAVDGFPGAITVSGNGRDAYVTSNLGNRVTAIDLTTLAVTGNAATGYFPASIATSGSRLYVTNGGLAAYQALAEPTAAPAFTNPPADQDRSSSLSIFALDSNGSIAPSTSGAIPNMAMDQVPDGVQNVGGAAPGAIVVRNGGAYAYVTMANVDRVATVSLEGYPRVVAGLDLRLFVNSPYGTQPSAEVLSRDGKRLFVALAGLNAVAVLDSHDPAHLHRLGLIPTAWYPSALALSSNGRFLFVANAKGVDGWGILQRVDLRHVPLEASTLSALRYNRAVSGAHPDSVVPPLRSGNRSSTIDRVVYIAIGDQSYDAVFGDLGRGNGDPAYVDYGESATPNLHALARTYALADNFYAADLNLDLNLQAALGGDPTLYAQRVLRVNSSRLPLDDHGNDPEDYPRVGYLFNALDRARISFRDYGGMLTLSGYRAQTLDPPPAPHNRQAQVVPPPVGLGGLYTLSVPGLAALDSNVDLAYPGWNPAISNATRVSEFISDMSRFVNSDQEPAFTYLWLPASASDGMAGADRALGRAIEFLSRTPHWSSTAVFVVGEGVTSPRDHVNPARSYALVVSPLAKPGYIGHAHLSVASVLKTEEEIFGLEPISLADLLSTDMADFFGQVPYPSTYQAIP